MSRASICLAGLTLIAGKFTGPLLLIQHPASCMAGIRFSSLNHESDHKVELSANT